MKTLLLTRHAKTVPGDGQMADFDRYLTSRGHKDPILVTNELIDLGIIPDKIISSPAKRAFQTAEIFADRFQISRTNISVADFLYSHFNVDSLIAFLQSSAAKFPCIQIIGHNPKIEELGAELTGSVYRRVPTSGTLVLEFDVNKWNHISEGSGTLLHFISPKPLRD